MIKFKLKGRNWVIKWAKDSKKEGNTGVTEGTERIIYIYTTIPTKEELHVTVLHELFHACLADTGVSDMDPTPDQFEELACNQFSYYASELVRLGSAITRELWQTRMV